MWPVLHQNPCSQPNAMESNMRSSFPERECSKRYLTPVMTTQLKIRSSFGRLTKDAEFLKGGPEPVFPDSFRVKSPDDSAIQDFQILQTPVRHNYCVHSCLPKRTGHVQNCTRGKWPEDKSVITEKAIDQSPNGSFLFVIADDAEKVIFILRNHGLDVQDIRKSEAPGILVVLFKTHKVARRAFITQREIGFRMVPHIYSKKNWFKNPSPKFHVLFKTRTRVTVKSGKSLLKTSIGHLLMVDARRARGCIIWADQLKGRRLRVVGYVGRFMKANGRIEERYAPPTFDERKVIGWISTICSKSKVRFVERLSGNEIEDYLYDSNRHALE